MKGVPLGLALQQPGIVQTGMSCGILLTIAKDLPWDGPFTHVTNPET